MCGTLNIIGIAGAAGAGKSEIAETLEALGYTRISMASPFKDMLKVLGLTDADLSLPTHKATGSPILCGKTPRFAMTSLGSGWGRAKIGRNLWVNVVQSRIIAHQTQCATRPRCKCKGIVIEDIRFPNEWQMLQRMGGVLWRVRRPDAERERTWLDRTYHSSRPIVRLFGRAIALLARPLGIEPLHESEFFWPDAPADAEFWNTGSKDDLAAQVRGLVSRLSSPKSNGDTP